MKWKAILYYKMKQKPITLKEYNKLMDKIIKLKLPVEETLIMMLEEAGKYKIKEGKK